MPPTAIGSHGASLRKLGQDHCHASMLPSAVFQQRGESTRTGVRVFPGATWTSSLCPCADGTSTRHDVVILNAQDVAAEPIATPSSSPDSCAGQLGDSRCGYRVGERRIPSASTRTPATRAPCYDSAAPRHTAVRSPRGPPGAACHRGLPRRPRGRCVRRARLHG